MDVSTAQQVLVIILAAALAIAIIIMIVVGVLVLKLLSQVKRMADKAEHAVESAQSVGTTIRGLVGPATALRATRFIFKTIARRRK